MTKLFNKNWWLAAGTRAIRTAAQTFIGSGIASATVLSDLNWVLIGSTVAISVLSSLAMSLANLPELDENTGKPIEEE